MAIAVCNGIRMYYETRGTGQPLILISGLGGDHTFWNPSMDSLAAHYQVIIFDTRGIGQTDAPEAPYSMPMFAADLAALMDVLGIATAHILGFSMGGNIALQFALDFPQRVRSLIIAASHAVVPPQIRAYVDAVLKVYESSGSARTMFDLIAPWLFSNRFLSHPENAAYLQFDDEDPYPQPLYAWRNQYLAQCAFDVRAELGRIQSPTLILAADEDPFAPLASAELLHQQIRGSALQIIPASGHLMNFEHPDLFHELVLAFLKENK